MAISLVDSEVGDTGSDVVTYTITLPSWGQQDGDMWLLMVVKDDDSVNTIEVTGNAMTVIQEYVAVTSRDSRGELSYRFHDGTETDWLVDLNDTERSKYILSLWRGVDPLDPLDSVAHTLAGYANDGGNPTVTSPAAPNTDGDVLINVIAGNDSTTVDLTPPAGHTLLQGSGSTAISVPYIYMGYETLSGTGAPGDRTWVDAGYLGDGAKMALYLKPLEQVRSSSAQRNSSPFNDITFTKPSWGQQDGDLWVVGVSMEGGNPITPPSGWTEVETAASTASRDHSVHVYVRTVDTAGDPASWTWSWGASVRAATLVAAVFTDLDGGNIELSSVTPTSLASVNQVGSTVNGASITTAADDQIHVDIMGNIDSVGGTYSAGTGFTDINGIATPSFVSETSVMAAYDVTETAGASQNVWNDAANGDFLSISFVLEAVAAAAGGSSNRRHGAGMVGHILFSG